MTDRISADDFARMTAREDAMQEAAAEMLRLVLPRNSLFHHSPNEGKRGFVGQRMAARSGMEPGFPDIVIFYMGQARCFELKTPTGRLSVAQKHCHERLAEAGVETTVVTAIGQLRAYVEEWLDRVAAEWSAAEGDFRLGVTP